MVAVQWMITMVVTEKRILTECNPSCQPDSEPLQSSASNMERVKSEPKCSGDWLWPGMVYVFRGGGKDFCSGVPSKDQEIGINALDILILLLLPLATNK